MGGGKDEHHGCIEVVQLDPDAIDFALPVDSTLSASGDVDLREFQVIVMVAFFWGGVGKERQPLIFPWGKKGCVLRAFYFHLWSLRHSLQLGSSRGGGEGGQGVAFKNTRIFFFWLLGGFCTCCIKTLFEKT